MPETVILDNEGLTLEDVINIVKNDYQLRLSENVKEKVILARKAIEKAVDKLWEKNKEKLMKKIEQL